MTKHKAPGRNERDGISLMDLAEMFPDEAAAVAWFETFRWPDGRHCGHCGGLDTKDVPNAKPMPYWCKDCRSYFSVRTGTAIERSKVPMRKWAFAIYLNVTSLKSVSSMKLHRDLKVTQKTAWFMQHRLREVWKQGNSEPFDGPAEADETFFGGRRQNMPKDKRKVLKGTGHVGKTIIAGVRDRATNRISAEIVPDTTANTLGTLVESRTKPDATIYTDEHSAYLGLRRTHESVRHGAGEYVRGDAHTQGIESFWAMLKRAHKGTFHKISPKHLQRYIDEFAGKHGIRDLDTTPARALCRPDGSRGFWNGR